ncbi:MAG TPA: glycerol-3-phosphate dehydrogenase C-terminal domain-containing protein, partial [Pontimonas sp.]|nr:glycerol-3-phosphate dehydrogenase C-terminal domain-containing protein [Pontimonas sp.]
LLGRYGTYASRIIAHLESAGDEPLVNHQGYSRGEIEFLVTREWVTTLADLVYRRTTLAFTGEASDPLLEELAGILPVSVGKGLGGE